MNKLVNVIVKDMTVNLKGSNTGHVVVDTTFIAKDLQRLLGNAKELINELLKDYNSKSSTYFVMFIYDLEETLPRLRLTYHDNRSKM